MLSCKSLVNFFNQTEDVSFVLVTDSGSDTEQQPLLPAGEGIVVETLPVEALSQDVLPETDVGEPVTDGHTKSE